jgi:hypothetical protein
VQVDGVWFAATNRLLRLDPTSLAITGQAPVAVIGHLTELAGAVYVSSDGTVNKLDPAS